jgi:hypothetical protein
MIVHPCIQGTPEWAALRLGIPCASQFSRIITPKGAPSKSAEMYLFELLAERLTGEATVGYTSHWMDRGSMLEADAVSFYEFTRDVETEKVGFITNDSQTIGASPDRLVGEDGLLEIKCVTPANHVGFLFQAGAAYEAHKVQTQAQLWIAERQFNDLMAYHPTLESPIYRVQRDDIFIQKMSVEVRNFSAQLEEMTAEAERKGWATKSARRPYDIVEAMRDSLTSLKQ